MTDDLSILCLAAVTVGAVHTALGPDHYIPFAAMSRIGRWSMQKTIMVTLLCGVGHIAGSIVLGFVGVAMGLALFSVDTIEEFRGQIAGWMMLAFGLAYFAWGIRHAIRNRPHTHLHAHEDGTVHTHEHAHDPGHLHVHTPEDQHNDTAGKMTTWILFTVFLFGPCEPLIPMLMYPAAKGSMWGLICVTILFALATLLTMTTIVVALCMGTSFLKLGRFERYGHALAGLVVLACGVAIQIDM